MSTTDLDKPGTTSLSSPFMPLEAREAGKPILSAPIRADEIKTFASFGAAFWASPSKARALTIETFAASYLLDLDPTQQYDRAVRALVDRVLREGDAVNTGGNFPYSNGIKFYALPPAIRFVVVALHSGHWSYARLAKILGIETEQVEELAWQGRVALSDQAYPSGSAAHSVSCPEYDSRRPWTQKFLDEEIHTSGDRLFFQSHLMACDACRASLSRCRDLYYSVESKIPRPEWTANLESSLQAAARNTFVLKSPSDRTFSESIEIFLGRREIRTMIAACFGILVVWKILFGRH